MELAGLHHVTSICSNAQRTLDYYRDLGFALVKKTVNVDDPHSYHLFLGDATGTPGTVLSFFEWPRAEPGRLGRGTLASVGLETPTVTADSVETDPDGLVLRLYPGEGVRLRDVEVIGNAPLYAGFFALDAPIRFAEPIEDPALLGPGVSHHVAWRASSDDDLSIWLERLGELGLRPMGIHDRTYFKAVSFRMPDGVLVELATDGPGFLVDEERGELGGRLSLPAWLEPERATLERELAPVI